MAIWEVRVDFILWNRDIAVNPLKLMRIEAGYWEISLALMSSSQILKKGFYQCLPREFSCLILFYSILISMSAISWGKFMVSYAARRT